MSIVDSFRISKQEVLQAPEEPATLDDAALLLKDAPYAMRLASWLHSHDVEVEFEAGPQTLSSGPFNQLDTRRDIPEKMGEAIVCRFGRKVTFGELSLNPRHTMEFVGFQRSGNVWVRQLIFYEIRSDDFRQRWDVLVRST